MKKIAHMFCLLVLAGVTALGQVPAQHLPSFKFYRFNNTPYTEKDLPQGRLLFLLFFDVKCEHCQRTAKYLGEHYKPSEKASLVMVSMDTPEKINQFMDTYGKQLKTKKNLTLLVDREYQFITKFQPKKYPSMYLYSAKKELLAYEDSDEAAFKIVNMISKTAR